MPFTAILNINIFLLDFHLLSVGKYSLFYNKALILDFIVFIMENEECPKCGGTKRIQNQNGTVMPCWDCLMKGDMDQHSKNPKDSGIAI
jgi:hypothetical protein